MVIIKPLDEDTRPLEEMAQFKGFGIVIEVRSNDHGKFGNKSSPAHAHILDNRGREIAQIELASPSAPSNPNEIPWYKTPNPPAGLASSIIKLANSKSKIAQTAGANMTVWQNVINFWLGFHGK